MKSYRSRNWRHQLHLRSVINSFILLTILLLGTCFTETTCSKSHKNSADPFPDENPKWAYAQGPSTSFEQNLDYDSHETTDREFNNNGQDENSLNDEIVNQSKDNLEGSSESKEDTDDTSEEYERAKTPSDPVLEPTGHPQPLEHQFRGDTQKSRFNQEHADEETSEESISKSTLFSTQEKSKHLESSSQTCLQVPEEIKNGKKICQKGDRGDIGIPGLSIEGEKGQKGEPCLFEYPSWAAKNKEYLNQMSSKASKKPEDVTTDEYSKRSYEIVPGAIVFKTRASLVHMTELSRFGTLVGTIVFIEDEEKFFGRVKDGWREIKMGGDVIFLPIRDSKSSNDTAKSEESDWISRSRRTSTNRRNKKIKPHLRIAALNDPWNGDLHGIRGADNKCSSEAKKAKVDGIFRAFLSHDTISLKELVKSTDRKLPIFNLQGHLLFKSWNSIFENLGMLTRGSAIFSFNGNNVLTESQWPLKRIWHGAKSSDVSIGKSSNCKSWNSDRFYNHGLASDLLLDGNLLLSQQKYDCRQSLIVLCIEITRMDKSE